MSRTTRYKYEWLIGFITFGTLAALVLYVSGWNRVVVIILVGIFLIPGRLQGMLWRDLFRGRALFDRGRPEAAITHFNQFLSLLEREKWRRGLWWLSWSVYTRDPEAMTLNNLGAAHMRLGQFEEAERRLKAAIDRDERYPVPHLNLGLLAQTHNEAAAAEIHFSVARRLGLSQGASDRIAQAASGVLAQVEGMTTMSDSRKDV